MGWVECTEVISFAPIAVDTIYQLPSLASPSRWLLSENQSNTKNKYKRENRGVVS